MLIGSLCRFMKIVSVCAIALRLVYKYFLRSYACANIVRLFTGDNAVVFEGG